MNPSRLSYTYSTDFNLDQAYSKDVILKLCEFCSRTFIPDSLTKHRKVCYKDFLKKRSNATKRTTSSRPTSSKRNTGDLADMSVTELMLKRQLRRMQWRGRHKEFIQAIREAREYSIAANCGLKMSMPSMSIDSQQEEMEQCKYCLRKFHKSSFEKHLDRCREYSIQSLRFRPNEAQIEAKRRLSLRLYYKPKSFRGDSPDDLSTSYSSNNLDCTYNSHDFTIHKSRASITVSNSACSKNSPKVKRQSSVSIHKSQIPIDKNKVKRHKSIVVRKVRDPGKSLSQSITQNKSMKKTVIPSQAESDVTHSFNSKKNYQDTVNIFKSKKGIQNTNNKSCLSTAKIFSMDHESSSLKSEKTHARKERISDKLKTISNLLTNTSANNSSRLCSRVNTMSKLELPNPADSLRKAKEIISFLDSRMLENKSTSEPRTFNSENNATDKTKDFDESYNESEHEFPKDDNQISQSCEMSIVHKSVSRPYEFKIFNRNCLEENKVGKSSEESAEMAEDLKYLKAEEIFNRSDKDICSSSTKHSDLDYAQVWKIN